MYCAFQLLPCLSLDFIVDYLQHEAAWRTGNWDFSLFYVGDNYPSLQVKHDHFNESLHR